MTAVTQDRVPEQGRAEGHDWRGRFGQVRRFTEELALPLSAEDQTVQSMPDVSPTKWHRAHTSWFFETFLLGPYLSGYREYHPDFAYLFNSYYEAAGPRYARSRRGCVSRPGCAEIAAYREHVDREMATLLEDSLDARAESLVDLGVHHEQQHQELLLMDIKHVLSMSPLDLPYLPAPRGAPVRGDDPGWLDHPGGIVGIGHDGPDFSFDNERPAHLVHLEPFAVSDRLVTCGQWLDFMADGGYRRPELWLSDGWAMVNSEGWDAPLYWRCEDPAAKEWTVHTLNGRQPVDPAEPVCHVSYYEAEAFSGWAGHRLPTEAEWEAVAAGRPVEGQFLDLPVVHPRAETGPSMFGGVWVWTSSSYSPYPGFRPAPGAVGEYNGKFMVNQQVLRGGACVTPRGHTRTTYRNFYPPAARWPFTGLRMARDL